VIVSDSLDGFASFVQQSFMMQHGNSYYITCISRPEWFDTVEYDMSKPTSESCSEKWAFLCFL